MNSKRRSKETASTNGGNDGGTITMGIPFSLKIVTDILLRLPIKSIVRFESVSKPFAALIKSPEFVSAHLRRHSASSSAILIRRQLSLSPDGFRLSLIDGRTSLIVDIPIPFMDTLTRLPKIVGSCCGLICLDVSMRYASEFLVWNAATKKVSSVPRSRIFVERPPFWMVAVGFGSNCENSDIKLVRIVYFQRRMEKLPLVRAEVYSWGLGKWRLIDADATQETLESCSITEGQRAIAVNGGLHWLGVDIAKPSLNKYIVSFDLGTEEFSRVRAPDYGSGRPTCVQLMELKGKLGLAIYPTQHAEQFYGCVEFWTVDDEFGDGGWTKIANLKSGILGMGVPVGFSSDSELIIKRDDGHDVYISLVDGNCRGKWNMPVSIPGFACEVYDYVESLFPVAPFEDLDVAED